VSRLVCPVRLDYEVRAGRELGRFLAGIAEGRFIGRRCPECRKVYVPPRGACPACGVPTSEDVPVADTGTVTTFCVVNVPFEGLTLKLPYVYASVLLDGADIPFAHLVTGLPAHEVRMGLRVRAEWAAERRPTLESILGFRPTGEPDAPLASYEAHV
jgi:uncharacterized OB-fold protein